VNFDDASCKAADVAYIFKLGSEYHDSKRLGRLLFAELNEMHAFCADLHLQNFSGYAFRFTDVLLGVANGEAVRCRASRCWRAKWREPLDTEPGLARPDYQEPALSLPEERRSAHGFA
jgi:hypothetical protein